MTEPRTTRAVTLPALPFTIPPATHDETAPRVPMIKSPQRYEAKATLGPAQQELFDYAERKGWECTLSQAAEALGIDTRVAQSRAVAGGFQHRFAGYRSRKSKGEIWGQTEFGTYGALAKYGHDANLDVNALPLDKLIRGEP